jgi:general secretion pathway protein M
MGEDPSTLGIDGGRNAAGAALLFLSTLTAVLATRADYAGQIDSIEPRLARLQGLIEHEDALEQALAGVQNRVSDHVYPATTDAAGVGAALQAELRGILGDSGFEVTNSQVLPVRRKPRFDYISVKVVARGSLEQLENSLAELDRFRPLVMVETLDVMPNRTRRRDAPDEQTITVTVTFLTLRTVA